MSSEIGHGGPQASIPQGYIDPSINTPPSGGSEGAKGTTRSAQGNGNIHADSISQAQVGTSNAEVKVSSYAWGTMSQQELDRAAPGDPRIGTHTGRLDTHPPADKGGTGNPFFNTTAMVAIFTGAFSVLQLMKWNAKVANRLGFLSTVVLMETAKANASEIMKAAKAQASALIKQAIVSGVMAGVSAASLGVTAYTSLAAKSQMKAQNEALNSQQTASKAKLDTASAVDSQKLGEIRAKTGLLSELKEMKKTMKTETTILNEADAPTSGGPGPNADFDMSKTYQKKMTEFDPIDKPDVKNFKGADDPDYMKKMDEWDNQNEFSRTLQAENPNVKKMNSKELDNEISKLEKEIKLNRREHLNTQQDLSNAQSNFESAKQRLDAHHATYATSLANARATNPWTIAMDGIRDITTKLGESASKIFEAQGALEAGRHNAEAKILETQTAILQKGPEMMQEIKRDAAQNADSWNQMVQKVSDTTQSGSRWAA